MSPIISELTERWQGVTRPFLIHPEGELSFSDVSQQETMNLSEVKAGDVVALIGDFHPQAISTFLHLIEKQVILVPLTIETRHQHEYFFESALVDFVIEGSHIRRINHGRTHELINTLRSKKHGGLVLFSTGTTGRPKAILHDLTLFLQRYETPRPTLRTINFLLFDHIGGVNTLLHTLFNKGTVIAPKDRQVENILSLCEKHQVEVLPTTPTFLRMMLMSGLLPERIPDSLKLITYGTERMDQPTLSTLCKVLPGVDFRQTFGMSELGIVRVKSEARDSLFMKIGGKGVETRVVDGVLQIRSATRMLGYLNAPSPFDREGWYHTGDQVEQKGDFLRVVGRTNEVINVGGLKFMASEVERVALQYPGVALAKVEAKPNPLTGHHVEILLQAQEQKILNKIELVKFFKKELPPHMVPQRVKIGEVGVGHRFKRS